MKVIEADPESCKDLWIAVLEDALSLMKKPSETAIANNEWSRNNARDRIRAGDWLRSKDGGVGSFRWICDMMNLDPDVVVARVFRRKAA